MLLLVVHAPATKEGHPDDRRSAYAVITNEGFSRFNAAAPVYIHAIEAEFASGLTSEELLLLCRVLNKIRKTRGDSRRSSEACAIAKIVLKRSPMFELIDASQVLG